MGLLLGVRDCIDNMWEEEEEQIWECGRSDFVLERLRNQPIYSPPQSPSSVFLICPQLYFSLPPPLTPQLHVSPPPTTSVLMSPYLDFSPPPPPPPPPPPRFPPIRFLFLEYVIELAYGILGQLEYIYDPRPRCITFICLGVRELLTILEVAVDIYYMIEILDLRLQSYQNTQNVRSPRLVEDSLRDFCSTDIVEVALKYLNELQRQRLKVKSDRLRSLCSTIELAKKTDAFKEMFDEMTQTFVLESIQLEFFLPQKSPKMVSIWSCLVLVIISRKISIQLLQVLDVQLPQTLHEKVIQLLSCIRKFYYQDCSLVEERSVEITVEVDATNNGAHGVKAYENFPIVSHSGKKNTRDKLKRNYKSISVLTLEDLQQHFGSELEAVAKSFGVSKSTLKRKCRRLGISQWPFQPERKKERLMEVIGPSVHEKHDSRLRCIRTPLHARFSPRTTAILDGGEMVQLDSSKQQSLVEFNVTNNSAHLVRASQSCSTVSRSDETNSRETLKRKCPTESALSFEDLQQHFGCKRDDAAKALGVSVSTVKRTCRQHGIPRWPSRKKKKVSKTDCILLEPQGEKDVSPTCSKMPTDGQTERGNEMVGHLQDQNEGPNLSNTENGSNEESITTLIFQDSVLDFERDCILLEPQGEKNVQTPTNGQTEVGNGMVGHIRDQNGIVPEFIEGPNLSNTENRSNEKSLTTPNFQDSVPGNYPAMDFSISSTYRESGEAGGSSELAFQPKELTPSTAHPNPNACVFTQPHISLREMLIENVGSSRDSKNFSTSALGFFMGAHVSESSCTMPLCSDQAPMQTMTTIPHIMLHLTEKQDVRTVTFKAQYREKNIKFRLSLPSGIVELKKQVTNRLGELGSFEVHYHDNDNDWILIGCDTDVWDCFELSSSSGNEVVRLVVRD